MKKQMILSRYADVENRFDISNYELDRLLPKGKK